MNNKINPFVEIPNRPNARFNISEALEIHNDIIKSDLTNRELCNKYNITPMTLRDIKFCINSYSFLKDMGAIIPEKGIIHREYDKDAFKRKFDNITALGIYQLLLSGRSANSIALELNIAPDTILNIKKCKGGYKYLKDKYGLEPLNH